MADVASYDGQAMLKGCGCDEQVNTRVADGSGKMTPQARYSDVYRQDAVSKSYQDDIKPLGKVTGKVRVLACLPGDSTLNFPHRYHAQIYVRSLLSLQP